VALLVGLTKRIKAALGRPVTVVATGGLANLFDRHTDAFDAIEPDLTIQGLSLLHETAVKRSK
jgi:type III pantothenate kinase